MYICVCSSLAKTHSHRVTCSEPSSQQLCIEHATETVVRFLLTAESRQCRQAILDSWTGRQVGRWAGGRVMWHSGAAAKTYISAT